MAADSDRFVHPGSGLLARFSERIGNSLRLRHLRRRFVGRLPFPVLASDVVDVVYATWLVDAARARRMAPPRAGLWEVDGRTPFTILTYRHGHFGPRAAGPLRRLFPSPLQSNWRLYLGAPLAGAPTCPTVAFVKNVFDSALYVLGTRVFSDALPSHLGRDFSLAIEDDEASICIRPGAGSAPSFEARFERLRTPVLPDAFLPFAGSWVEAVERLACQDAAVAPVFGMDRTAMASISLPVETSSIEPLGLLSSTLRCPLLDELGAGDQSLCFLLPEVHFQVLDETLL